MANFYLKEQKALFVHITKTGGWNIRNKIFKPFARSIGVVPDDWDYDFSFAFVRNPIDRFKSLYKMFKYGGLDCNDRHKPSLTIDKTIEILENDKIKPFKSGTVLTLEEDIKHHGIPMTHPFNCIKHADSIYRFEEYEDSIKEICRKLSFNISSIPKSNSSKIGVDIEMSNKQIGRLKEVYKQDFEEFGYD